MEQLQTGAVSLISETHAQRAADILRQFITNPKEGFEEALQNACQKAIGKSTRHKVDINNRKLNMSLAQTSQDKLSALEGGDIVSKYYTAILDTFGLVFEAAGLCDSEETGDVSVELETTEVSLLRKTLKKFTSALKTFSESKTFDSVKNMAEAIWDFFNALWKGIGKVIFDTLVGGLSWLQWLEVGVVAIGTILAWMATGGLAAIGEIILLLNNTVLTIIAWNAALDAGPPSAFIKALIDGGGKLSNQIIINQDYNPSVVNAFGYTYLFTNSKSLIASVNDQSGTHYIPGVEYSYANENNLFDYMKNQEKLRAFSDSGQVAAQMTTESLPAYWHKFDIIPGSDTNASSPSAVLYDSKIYVFFKEEGDSAHIKYCILTNPDNPETPVWDGPHALPDFVTTQTAPSAVTYDKDIFLFFQGTGDQKIWLDIYDGSTWQARGGLKYVQNSYTSTTPSAHVLGNKVFIPFKSSSNTNVWMNLINDKLDMPSPTELTTSINTYTTPKLVLGADGYVYLYYCGTEEDAYLYTHKLLKLEEFQFGNLQDVVDYLNSLNNPEIYNTGFKINQGSPAFVRNNWGDLMFYSNAPGAINIDWVPRPY